MSEDTDDRMERAERIRELREAGGDARDADHEGEPADGEAGATEAPSAAAAGGTTGIQLPDKEQIEDAREGRADAVEAEAPDEPGLGQTARGRLGADASDARTRVLEFRLGEELFCIDIAGLEEIVTRDTITRVPNTPEYVEGVVDLRGQITTILDAKRLLDIETGGPEELIAVFAPDAYEEFGAVGWIVDEVRQVGPVADERVHDPPADDEYVEGVVDHEDLDELALWVDPERAMAASLAETGEADPTT
jgi:purine-binding chemotaxis protein CheW